MTTLLPHRLAAVLVLAAVLRLVLFAYAWPHPERFLYQPDSAEYMTLAQNLIAGRGFSQSLSAPFVPDLRRTPLYPALLALISFSTNDRHVAAILFNILLGVLTVALVYALAQKWAGTTTALAAAMLLATDLTGITYNNLLLTETTFTLLLTLAVLALIEYSLRPRARQAWLSGLAFGLATLCRPIGIFLAPVLLLVFAWPIRTRGHWHAVRDYLLLNAGFFLLTGLWLARNFLTFGVTDFSSLGAVNLYFHRAAFVAAQVENTDVVLVREGWQRDFDARAITWSEAEKIAWLNARAREMIAAHPTVYAQLYLEGLARMFGPERDSLFDLLGVPRESTMAFIILIVGWLQLLLVYALAGRGSILTWRAPRMRLGLIVMLNVILYFIAIAGPEVYARFRVPLMPLLALLAGCGVQKIS